MIMTFLLLEVGYFIPLLLPPIRLSPVDHCHWRFVDVTRTYRSLEIEYRR